MRIISDIEYAPGLHGDLFLPEGMVPESGFAAAVLIHGGSWNSMDRHAVRGIADFLVENGLAVFNIDYRLAPTHRWPSGLDDCRKAVEWLAHADYPVNAYRIFAIGASAGGHYALLTGLTLPHGMLCGIVSISGIDDVFIDSRFAPGRYMALLGEIPDEKALNELNPATYLSPDSPPIFCTHSRHDEVVPYEECSAFQQAVFSKGGNISVYSYDYDRHGQGHAIWIPGSSPHRLYPDIEAAILEYIKNVLHDRRSSNVKN